MNDFQKQYEEILKDNYEETEIKDEVTAEDLMEFLKVVSPKSVIKIDNKYVAKDVNITNGNITLFTSKN